VLGLGLGVALLIVAAGWVQRGVVETIPSKTPQLGPDEILAIVAHDMRSSAAAAEVLQRGQASFDDGTWYVSVGDAHFRVSQRNRVVVPGNPAAIEPQFQRTTQ
jgi:hypothetical protein